MEVIEKGLSAERVKVGGGEKTPGLAFKTVTVKRVVLFILAVGLVLLGGAAYSYREAIKERYNAFMAQRRTRVQRIKSEASAIAQNLQLEAALAMQSSSKEDIQRMIKRIRSFSDKKIEEATKLVPADQSKLTIQLSDVLAEIGKYIDSEFDDFTREFEAAEKHRQVMIEKIRKHQTAALEKLLTRVTDVRLEALEDMLTELFDRMEQSLKVYLHSSKWEDLEGLVDRLYQEDLSADDGRVQFELLRPYFGESGKPGNGIPESIEARIRKANTPGDLADALDELYEGAQLYQGRERLAEIKAQWTEMQRKADQVDEHADEAALEEAERLYTKSTVDAVLAVQELINKGHIPQDVLDFEAIDLDNDDYPEASRLSNKFGSDPADSVEKMGMP